MSHLSHWEPLPPLWERLPDYAAGYVLMFMANADIMAAIKRPPDGDTMEVPYPPIPAPPEMGPATSAIMDERWWRWFCAIPEKTKPFASGLGITFPDTETFRCIYEQVYAESRGWA